MFLLVALAACAAARPPAKQPPPTPPAMTPALREFLGWAGKMSITFETPAGFTETPVRENMDQAYHYAVVSADKRTEMRFTLRPYDQMPANMRNRGMGFLFFMTGIDNVVRLGDAGKFSDGGPLPATHYNADAANLIVVRWFKPDIAADAFGDGYAICLAIFMHRENVGDAYTFVLSKDKDALERTTEEQMHAMRFAAR